MDDEIDNSTEETEESYTTCPRCGIRAYDEVCPQCNMPMALNKKEDEEDEYYERRRERR